jgi:hypothetical protein
MQEQIKELIARYIKGECADQEVELLEKWFDRVAVDEVTGRILNHADEERMVMELRKALAAREERNSEAAEGETEDEPEAGMAWVARMCSRSAWSTAAVWMGLIIIAGGLGLHSRTPGIGIFPREIPLFNRSVHRVVQKKWDGPFFLVI